IIHLQRSIKKTIVFVTHDIKEAMKLGDRICLMNKGKIIQLGTPDELMNNPVNNFVTDFVGSPNPPRKEFDLENFIHPLPIQTQQTSSTSTVHASASLLEVLEQLSRYNQLIVEKNGTPIGMIDRQIMIHYFSRYFLEGGINNE